MFLMVLASCWALGVGGYLLRSCSVVMRLATSFLYVSLSDVGSFETAVSASRARFSSQLWRLVCKLCLRSERTENILLPIVQILESCYLSVGICGRDRCYYFNVGNSGHCV
jgi:hypothetical protein